MASKPQQGKDRHAHHLLSRMRPTAARRDGDRLDPTNRTAGESEIGVRLRLRSRARVVDVVLATGKSDRVV